MYIYIYFQLREGRVIFALREHLTFPAVGRLELSLSTIGPGTETRRLHTATDSSPGLV